MGVERLVLVAPWMDPLRTKDPAFFDGPIDRRLAARNEVHIVVSDNDSSEVAASVQQIRTALPASTVYLFPGYGHFCLANMGTETFPELRDIALHGRKIPA